MPVLEVPGATLSYETVGQGPLLLCISGARGIKDIWRGLASQLPSYFSVVSYDRRGFSQSYLSAVSGQDYSHRLAVDADDAARLIEHLSSDDEDKTATVLGNSSGAIVALELLSRHPEVVRTLVVHEPPVFTLLSDLEHLTKQQQEIYDIYRGSGVPPALQRFAEHSHLDEPATSSLLQVFDPRNGQSNFSNAQYWFERELMVYPFRDFEHELTKGGSVRAHRDCLLLVNGKDSEPAAPHCRANLRLREELELEQPVLHFSGGHSGYRSHAGEFAAELRKALKDKDGFYVDV